MRARGQLCAVTPITKDEPGFRHQAPRLATSVVGNVRQGLNCEKEVQKNETLSHESLLTRVVTGNPTMIQLCGAHTKVYGVKISTVELGRSS